MDYNKPKNFLLLYALVCVIICVVAFAISRIWPPKPTSTPVPVPTATPLPPPIPGIIACTNFKYSDWSNCDAKGTQNRTIIKALPEGCTSGNPIQFQSCIHEPIPSGPTGEEIYQRMINQIKNAPEQTISTSYISGADAGNTTTLTWRVDDSGLSLHVRSEKDQSTMVLVDANFDSQPDYISDRGQPKVAISSSDQYYTEIIFSWATFTAYFASYLLK